MTQAQTPNRNRPAAAPGGMQCENCDKIFIGEEWHAYCAICQRFDRGRAAADGKITKPSKPKPYSSGCLASDIPGATCQSPNCDC